MTIFDEFHRDEQRVLDRLIDGELAPGERRELLAGLDDEPGAWRRCALTFLEAQAWRWQMSRMAAEPLVAQASAAAPAAAVGLKRRSLWGWSLAMAAGLLVAFSLGTRFPTGAGLQEPMLAEQSTAQQHLGQATEEPWEARELADDEADADGEALWETLTLVSADGTEDGSEFQLRVLKADEGESANSDNQQALAAQVQSAVSARLLRELEDAGWEVQRQRRLVPFELSDGRRMIVPVEEVDIRYPEVAQF